MVSTVKAHPNRIQAAWSRQGNRGTEHKRYLHAHLQWLSQIRERRSGPVSCTKAAAALLLVAPSSAALQAEEGAYCRHGNLGG